MGFFNPYGERITFAEEDIAPIPPQVIAETVTFDLTESVTVTT